MAKYAVTVCAGEPYFGGLNSMLNSLEYYKVKDIDVHIGATHYIDGYYNLIKNRFPFRIEVHYLEDLCGFKREELNDQDYVAAKYGIQLRIKDDYEAILHMNARCCPVDDISQYFVVAAKTGYMICADNPRFRPTIDEIHSYISSGRTDDFATGQSIIQVFYFFNPKEYGDFLEYTWAGRNNFRDLPDKYVIPCPINVYDERWWVKALCEVGKIENVLYLPNVNWIIDFALYKDRLSLTPDKSLIWDFGEKVKMVWGRYYYDERFNIYSIVSKEQVELEKTLIWQNVHLITQLVRFFNYNCNVSLDEVRGLGGTYPAMLGGIP